MIFLTDKVNIHIILLVLFCKWKSQLLATLVLILQTTVHVSLLLQEASFILAGLLLLLKSKLCDKRLFQIRSYARLI